MLIAWVAAFFAWLILAVTPDEVLSPSGIVVGIDDRPQRAMVLAEQAALQHGAAVDVVRRQDVAPGRVSETAILQRAAGAGSGLRMDLGDWPGVDIVSVVAPSGDVLTWVDIEAPARWDVAGVAGALQNRELGMATVGWYTDTGGGSIRSRDARNQAAVAARDMEKPLANLAALPDDTWGGTQVPAGLMAMSEVDIAEAAAVLLTRSGAR